MRILIISLLFLFIAACSGEDSASNQHTGERDVADFDASEDAAETEDAADRCTCNTTDACCDGCQPTNVGQVCDDARECTLSTTCQPDGTCGGATGSPCDELLTEPQCQAASCDDVLGCTVQNTRQGLPCEADGIRDARCDAGECKGTVCTCDAENECCDGCLPLNEGEACDDGNPRSVDDTCTAGVCAGTPCQCDEETECCDGCFFVARDTQCSDQSIASYAECTGYNTYRRIYRRPACTGESSECTNDYYVDIYSQHESTCSVGTICKGNGLCKFP